jgi:hypothetical protein
MYAAYERPKRGGSVGKAYTTMPILAKRETERPSLERICYSVKYRSSLLRLIGLHQAYRIVEVAEKWFWKSFARTHD